MVTNPVSHQPNRHSMLGRALGMVLLAYLVPVCVFGYQIVPSQVEYAVDIAHPTQLVTCLDHVWVYSHESKVLSLIQSETGKRLKDFSLERFISPRQLSALSCFREKLLVVSHPPTGSGTQKQEATSSLTLMELNGRIELEAIRSISSPAVGRMTDVKCNSSGCAALIGGRVFRTEDLKTWKAENLPKSHDIPYRGANKQLNPFDDWQSSLNITDGFFSRITLAPFMKFALLDPFRSDIILERNDGTREKWGGWGVWEGNMLSPRAFSFVDPGVFVVFDSGLKAVFVFTPNGDYLGALASGKMIWAPEYVTAIHGFEDKVLVADFLKSRLTAFRFLRDPRDGRLSPKSQFTRANLFRRNEVLSTRNHFRCLICHDGTVVDSLSRYVKTNANHPVHFALKGTTRLYLDEGNEVTCATCHNPHHGTDMEGGSPTQVRVGNFQTAPPYLRDSFRGLCADCHSDHAQTGSNHPDKKGDLCGKCHVIHGGSPRLLAKPQLALCANCHEKQKIEHKPVENLLQTDRAKTLLTDEGQISCRTCHQVHKNVSGEKHSLISKEPVMEFCASCHGKKTEVLFDEFHKRVAQKRGKL